MHPNDFLRALKRSAPAATEGLDLPPAEEWIIIGEGGGIVVPGRQYSTEEWVARVRAREAERVGSPSDIVG